MQSDYHRRFHAQARKLLDARTFEQLHLKARGSTGGAAPRTPKNDDRQDDEPVAPDKQQVTKSALDTIRSMWERTLDAVTGRTTVNKSGMEGALTDYFAPANAGQSPKNPRSKPKKKRVTKSALDALAQAVAEHDGIEPDGVVAIQLGAHHGRTRGAIGLAPIAQDKATIEWGNKGESLPFPDASVQQIYVRKSVIDAGLDLDGLMPELRRISAPGARIYSDCRLTTVNKSSAWDEDAHPRSENGEFGSGGKAAANSSASHARNRTAQKLAEHSVERMKALKKRINKSALASWDEDAHPRADNGQFGEGSGSGQKKSSFAESTSHLSANDHRTAANALTRLAGKARKAGNTAQADSYKKLAEAHKEQFKAKSSTAAPAKAKTAEPSKTPAANSAKVTTKASTAQGPDIDKVELSEAQAKAFKAYQGVGYHDINAAARGVKSDYARVTPTQARASAKQLSSAINQHEVKSDTVVYRGITSNVGYDHFKPGDKIRERGFSSTSSDQKVAAHYAEKGGTIMHISVPKGAHALPVQKHINNSTSRLEKEFILNANSNFRVDKISHENGHRILHVTLVSG